MVVKFPQPLVHFFDAATEKVGQIMGAYRSVFVEQFEDVQIVVCQHH
jgi:hypothetical protein